MLNRQQSRLLAAALFLSLVIIAAIIVVDHKTGFMVMFKGLLEALVVLFVLLMVSQYTRKYATELTKLVLGLSLGTVIYSVLNEVSFLEFLARCYATVWGTIFAYAIFVFIQLTLNKGEKPKRKGKRKNEEILASYQDGDTIYDLEDLINH